MLCRWERSLAGTRNHVFWPCPSSVDVQRSTCAGGRQHSQVLQTQHSGFARSLRCAVSAGVPAGVPAGDNSIPSTGSPVVPALQVHSVAAVPKLVARPRPIAPAAGSNGEVLLELRNVHKSFGTKRILQGATMQVRRGQAIGIIGGSGTGKSTTLRLMAGLLAPDKGDVFVKGVRRQGLASDDDAAGKGLQLGLVFQSGALFDSLTVGENVGFLLYEHSKLPTERIKELVARSLGQVGLSGVESLMPAELSGGMKKRVALARAIIRDDENDTSEQVIMYDEPTAGLDPVASTVVEDLIRSLHRSDGDGSVGGISSYIVVTHQHSTIRRAVDSIIFLHEGSVVWTGSVDEFEETDVPIVKQFRTGSLKGPIEYK
mmetsp:Transcript_3586/g.10418  ORF Transcript_3586/g.10418 Transcript_3586/m.10418 type:complete len:373 (+) Transcript_3586:487-1605(+)